MYRHASGFYAGPTFDFVGRAIRRLRQHLPVKSYGLLGLRGGYAAERWEAFAELRNLLDEDYIATVNVRNQAAQCARPVSRCAPLRLRGFADEVLTVLATNDPG